MAMKEMMKLLMWQVVMPNRIRKRIVVVPQATASSTACTGTCRRNPRRWSCRRQQTQGEFLGTACMPWRVSHLHLLPVAIKCGRGRYRDIVWWRGGAVIRQARTTAAQGRGGAVVGGMVHLGGRGLPTVMSTLGCSSCGCGCGFATRLVHVYANFLQQGNESTDAKWVLVSDVQATFGPFERPFAIGEGCFSCCWRLLLSEKKSSK